MDNSMKCIYTMTVFNLTYKKHPKAKKKILSTKDKWVMGWTSEFLEAKKVIETNHCDISEEGYYKWALIEEVGEGLWAVGSMYEGWWFKWNDQNKKYIQTKKPSNLKNIVHFSIG